MRPSIEPVPAARIPLHLPPSPPTIPVLTERAFMPPAVSADRTAPVVEPARARIALIGTYLPRKCGIATFTADTKAAIEAAFPSSDIDIYEIWRPGEQRARGARHHIAEGDGAAFRQAASIINRTSPDAVWLQHEFGIFGGPAGDAVLELVRGVAAPLIVTLHTVLEHPDRDQRRVMDALVARASTLVVMTRRAMETLEDVYGADQGRIAIIEHGVPDRPFGRSAEFKQKLGFSGPVMLTFGLLSPGKGIERAIEALPAIVARHPGLTYCIAGATHPNLVAREGEAYRETLVALAQSLGVSDHIRWIDAFLDTPELLDLIEAADIYVTPYPGAGQSVSGTLSYAVALGKAVISTPYLHAAELLDNGHGVLVPFGDASAIAEAAIGLLDDPERLARLQSRAYARGRDMLWSAFATKSMELVFALRPDRARVVQGALPRPGLNGLLRMCDDCGILQHATYAVPDRRHGYCVDDNARALMLFARIETQLGPRERSRLPVFAAFVNDAWNEERGGFRNFMDYARRWLEDEGSEDSNGRSLWALGVTACASQTAGIRDWAEALFDRSLRCAEGFSSPRAVAFAMLGSDAMLEANPDHRRARLVLEGGGNLLFQLLADARGKHWPWFESVLAYDNARLPEALLRVGLRLDRPNFVAAGLETLDWLMAVQQSECGYFRPVGSESFGKAHQLPTPFDQQPVEAWAAVDACAAGFAASGDRTWIVKARTAYDWFLGLNDRSMAVGDVLGGSCCDGITPLGLNANQGAESVLAFQLATVAIRDLATEFGNKA